MIRQLRGRQKPLIAASVVLLTLAAIFVPLPGATASPRAVTFEVDARQFAFEPATIAVRRGDTVTIHFQSLDASHGLSIDGYGVDMQAEPGKTADVTFVADKIGAFRFRCSVTCGPLHPFMIGELTVEPDLPLAHAITITLLVAVGASLFFWTA
ncbi:MAG: cupredoxin domain-containing protein [Chloroflexi bacterium]|nr:cupredoxin domain-containing protein [Chloroflexota bacterium]